MSPTAATLSALGLLAVAALVAPTWEYHHVNTKILEVESTLRSESAAIAQLKTSNTAASPAPSAPALSETELRELLKLRAQFTPLRKEAARAEKLRAAVQQLENLPAPSLSVDAAPLSQPIPPGQSHLTLPQLANAGFATPESALTTLFWAMSNTNLPAALSCFHPQIRALFEAAASNNSEDILGSFQRAAGGFNAQTTGLTFDNKGSGPDDSVEIDAALDGSSTTNHFYLINTRDGWHILGGSDPH